MYLSNAEPIIDPKTQISEKESAELEKLAADTFAAFHPYINIRDCGKKLWDEEQQKLIPKHMITKESFRFGTIYGNLTKTQRKAYKPRFIQGKRKGRPFHYWGHYRRGIMTSEMMAQHIRGDETYYYTSSTRNRALIRWDIDAHDGQLDELEAKELFQKEIIGNSIWSPSERGQGGYGKLFYGPVRNPDMSLPIFDGLSADRKSAMRERIERGLTAKEFNKLIKRAEKAYERYLKHHGITCTFELKGSVTEYGRKSDGSLGIKSGSLGKFPFAAWDREHLEEFKRLPEIRWYIWEWQIQQLEMILDRKDAAQNKADVAETKTDVPRPRKPKLKKKIVDPETCAFTRNRKECLRFVRKFYRDHNRTPDHGDFLQHLRTNRLYTGQWDDPESDRSHRTARILDYTLQTFEPKKLGRGEGRWGNIPVLPWLRRYARRSFGGLTGSVLKNKNKLIFCDDGTIESGRHFQKCKVSPAFVYHCTWVILTCIEDLPDNDGLPEDRIVKAWDLLPGAPAWNRDHYAIVRDFLEARGVVEIYDKHHRPNKCWRWRKGRNYPTSPEGLRRKLKKCRGIDLGFLFPKETISNNKDKITPYCKVIEIDPPISAPESVSGRPPPSKQLLPGPNRRNN